MSPDIFTELFKDRRTPGQKRRDRFVVTLIVVSLIAIFGVGVYTLGGWFLHLFH